MVEVGLWVCMIVVRWNVKFLVERDVNLDFDWLV